MSFPWLFAHMNSPWVFHGNSMASWSLLFHEFSMANSWNIPHDFSMGNFCKGWQSVSFTCERRTFTVRSFNAYTLLLLLLLLLLLCCCRPRDRKMHRWSRQGDNNFVNLSRIRFSAARQVVKDVLRRCRTLHYIFTSVGRANSMTGQNRSSCARACVLTMGQIITATRTETCNSACTDALMNSDHKPKTIPV